MMKDAMMDTESMEKDRLLPNGWLNSHQPEIVSGLNALTPGTYYPYEKGSCLSRNGSTRKLQRRAVLKNGEFNVEKSRISQRTFRFFTDFFTVLVDARWRWTLATAFLITVFILLAFALVWWLIVYAHGDLEMENMPPFQNITGWVPCITNIYGFTSCFLFSVEIHTTIGYGSRHINYDCPETVVIMCLQSLSGVIVPSFMVGIVFAKLSRPKHRTNTLVFSKQAVINQRDRFLCLIFRVGDLRKSRIIDAKVNAYLISSLLTKEGELLDYDQTELNVQVDSCENDPFFIWPIAAVHVIDSGSPFYDMSAADIIRSKIEIVAVLEGIIESTGHGVQARSSYITCEVLWGRRFVSMVSYNKKSSAYEVDYSKFDETTKVNTPLCSGRMLGKLLEIKRD